MINFILAPLWVFMEILLLDTLADAFLIKKISKSRLKRVFGLLLLTMLESVLVLLLRDVVMIKIFLFFLPVYAYLLLFYHTTLGEAFSVYVINYSVIISIDFICVSGYYYIFGASENIGMLYIMCMVTKCTELGSGFLIRWLWRRGGGSDHTLGGNTGVISVLRNHCGGRDVRGRVPDSDAVRACGGNGFNGRDDRTQYFSVFLYAAGSKNGTGKKQFEGCGPANKDAA